MVKIAKQAVQKCTLNKPLHCPKNGEHLSMPKRLIKKMWPEVLSEPINPEKGLQRKVKKFIQSRRFLFPLIRNLRYFKQKISFKKKIL